MSLAVRVVPCLDVAGGRVVKGLRFENLRDAGDPVEAARRYEREGADEIALLDVAASQEARGTLVSLVARVAEGLSIPFTVGGGVRSVEDAGRLLAAGADRVTVNTAAVADPDLISRLAERYGAQCVVVAIDAKREPGTARALVMTHGGRRSTGHELEAWAAEAARRGAGEILLTSVDADGTQSGFDVDLLRRTRAVTDVPIIASGGAGAPEHFVAAVRDGGADALLAASVFHDRRLSVGAVKRALAAAGVDVRPTEDPFRDVTFGPDGLAPVVVRDATSGQVLTLAWANREALERTRETGASWFFSRSRRALWQKGETSGNTQRVVSVHLDCDRDALVYDVVPAGPACHRGTRTCFVEVDRFGADPPRLDLGPLLALVRDRQANPVEGSYTNSLLDGGPARAAQKVGEEAVETALAAVTADEAALAEESADLLYHLAVLLVSRGVDGAAVERALARRRGAPRREP